MWGSKLWWAPLALHRQGWYAYLATHCRRLAGSCVGKAEDVLLGMPPHHSISRIGFLLPSINRTVLAVQIASPSAGVKRLHRYMLRPDLQMIPFNKQTPDSPRRPIPRYEQECMRIYVRGYTGILSNGTALHPFPVNSVVYPSPKTKQNIRSRKDRSNDRGRKHR